MLKKQIKNKSRWFRLPMMLALMASLSAPMAFADDSNSGQFDLFQFLRRIFTSHPNPIEPPQEDVGNAPRAFQAPAPVASQAPQIQAALSQPVAIVTQDSSFQTEGVAPANVRWLMVQLHKEGESQAPDAQTIPWVAGEAFPKVTLDQGPGKYHVDYFVSDDLMTKNFTFLTGTDAVNQDSRETSNLLPSVEVQSDSPEIIALADRITSRYSDSMQKSHAIHDWVAENIDYDENEAKIRIQALKTGESSPQDALSVLHSHRGVCEGYANLVSALHKAIGIRSRVIFGNFIYASHSAYEILTENGRPLDLDHGIRHAWNEIELSGRGWVPMDATEDSGEDRNGAGWKRNSTAGQDFFNPDLRYFEFTHKKSEVAW